MTLDLIVPVYHPDKKLSLLIRRIAKQTVIPRHLYIMHTVPSELPAWLFKYSSWITVVPVKKESFDHGGTRKYAASLSDADIILFMTQDAVPKNKDLVGNILKGFETEGVSAVYGRQICGKEADPIEHYTRQFNYPNENQIKSKDDLKRLGIKTYFCSNVCAAYRKDVYDSLGGFVEKTIFNEDMIMAANMIQAGYSVFYASNAIVIHSHKYTCKQQFTRNFDLGVSQYQFHDVFGGVKSESEGIQLVKKTACYLFRSKKIHQIPDLILQSGFKFLGYRFGLHYDRLPKWLVTKCSMNPGYWR